MFRLLSTLICRASVIHGLGDLIKLTILIVLDQILLVIMVVLVASSASMGWVLDISEMGLPVVVEGS